MKNRNTGTKQTSRDKNFPHPVLTSYFKIDTINYYHKDVINKLINKANTKVRKN